MTAITLITVRGTAERRWSATNMLSVPALKLGDRVEWVDLDYEASIACFNPTGNVLGVSEAQSRREGVTNLAAAIRSTPNLVVLAGYSLGALVVSDFLAARARGAYRDCTVLAVVNIANPARRAAQSYGRPSFGYGLDGAHPAWPAGIDVYEIANPVDGITSMPAESPLRPLADQIRTFSLGDPHVWFDHMVAQLDGMEARQARAQWWEPTFWQSYAEAPAWLRGYLFDGQHTRAYTERRWYGRAGRRISAQDLVAETVAIYA
ncbi:hypothetical protein GS4_39_00420 [Gordonia soli NBRC 108243]|uniref:PE-PPE domain-containing protein n=2 Tax=Gordonia soli TaxID=320799 RepID=M0QR13_9ACTN|nr:hypothetical protein GS4_39_00420 [Gordonia soli NBRC 108243]